MSLVKRTLLYVLASLMVLAPALLGQSLTTGDIAGNVTDSSHAVVPNAKVALRSLDTGLTQNATTNGAGDYRFTLLKPGRYQVTVTQSGFQTTTLTADVSVGNVATLNAVLQVGQTSQTIEVSDAAAVLNPEPSTNTSFSPQQLSALPASGGDITTFAFTASGVVVNNLGSAQGYGNFTANGMPGTSNLYTVNGENDMDPYFNINNSGATNMTLGANELQEATIVTNAYGGQYGQLSGAQVTFVSKSGTNQFHGNAKYWWNGRTMNSNSWINNSYGEPRAFSNANQWADSLGGPIHKDTTFFFVDNEGLRFVLPSSATLTVPTTEFSNAVLNNIQVVQPGEYNAYKTMLGLWGNAPGIAGAQPLPNSSYCKGLTLPGFDPATQRCAQQFTANPTALGSEWILAVRVDQKLSDNDNAFFRYRGDHGVQPTTLDPISPNFNAISKQPSWDAQAGETHIFGAGATNDFKAALSHYVAQFAQDTQLVQKTFPYQIVDSGAVPFTGFNSQMSFPQGRNITQYQFLDDFTASRGNHTLKFGANFRRYDVSDHGFTVVNPGVYFGYTTNGLQNFANGIAYQYRRAYTQASNVPIALWGLHVYGMDEWRVKPNLKLTLSLAGERSSNPVCQFNCFANFKSAWAGLPSVTNANPGSVPYGSDILANQHSAFPGVDGLDLSPRIGFSWSPRDNNKWVVSGGFGLFYDAISSGVVDRLLTNPPVKLDLRVRPTNGTLPFVPGGALATWTNSAQAFSMQKTYAQIASELKALGSTFAAPAFQSVSGTFHMPRWEEWNLQVQRELTNSTALIVNYVGNHGSRIPYANSWPNAYDQYGLYGGVAGVSASVPVPNYGTVTQMQTGAISNYQGLNVTVSKRLSRWFAGHLNYTWSHNLDEVSNGGVFTYGDVTGVGGGAILQQINPGSLRANNYGNSDYDVRHSFSADWVVNPTVHFGGKATRAILNGWEWSGKWFMHTGIPYSVVDLNSAVGNYAGSILGTPVGQGWGNLSCGPAAAGPNAVSCLNAGAYVDGAATTFNGYTRLSPGTRNQIHGPNFFDVDMSLYRTFSFKEKYSFGVGAQAFNVFNHPNFAAPDSGLGDATFGQILSMMGTPSSPYGNFLGFDSSVRVVQLTAKFTF